ncbi:VanZ family protein [Rheinheimera riviphila]|uniref:VanZ family protein n=1 Tax=Rheinheimera riviphila TaxID=1834037 RepID=UPI0013E40916|nr:VanZ family protein [Rheinheimera riviphila]
MSKQNNTKWISIGRALTDLWVWTALLSMLFLWSAKYLVAGAPLLLKFETWVGSDAPMHFTLGFLLPLCIGWLGRVYRKAPRKQALFFLLIACLYACDELLQMLLPFRSATWSDFLISMAGWCLAMLCWFCLWQLLRGRFAIWAKYAD